ILPHHDLQPPGCRGSLQLKLVKHASLQRGLTSTQVGKACQFTTGLAVLISTKDNETRIQPNATCPEKK
ncbi:hypothetical protein E7V43_23185, partial [Escherichia coli]|nr:hypothetical protein [Escherichia coli]